VLLYAFDLIEIEGMDLRPSPLEVRKTALVRLLRKAGPGIALNEHIGLAGVVVFRHACKLGFQGIVSKRLGSRYRSGRSPDWLDEEPGRARGEARGRGGLGPRTMAVKRTRREM
jgi:bifunctional non-homologous end joining protein LigD